MSPRRRIALLIAVVLLVMGCVMGGVGATTYTVTIPATYDAKLIRNPGVDTTFSDLRNGSGTGIGIPTNSGTQYIATWIQASTNAPYYTFRYHDVFVTNTTLPAGAIPLSATVSLFYEAKSTSMGVELPSLVDFFPTNVSSPTSINAGDYDKTTYTRLASDISSPTVVNASSNFTLNAYGLSYLNLTGNTPFMIESNRTVDNIGYNWVSGGTTNTRWRPLEYLSGMFAPTVTITYTTPSPAPIPITNLQMSPIVSCNEITVNWTNSTDSSVDTIAFFKNGTLSANLTTATGAITSYDLSSIPQSATNSLLFINLTDAAPYQISALTCSGNSCNTSAWTNITVQNTCDMVNYLYGDSTVMGMTGDGFTLDGYGNYIMQMAHTNQNDAVSNHNRDGSGWATNTMLKYISTHPPTLTFPQNVFISGGVNDMRYNSSGTLIAQNKTAMRNWYANNGSTVTMLINTMTDPNQWAPFVTLADQRSNFTIEQDIYTTANQSWVPIYDAIDTDPGNCVADSPNTSLYIDGAHPTREANTLISNYIWGYLQGTNPCGYHYPPILYSKFTPTVPITLMYPMGQAFTDTSTGSPTAWNWSFGDGTYSTDQNVYHLWWAPGIYNVSLNASTSTAYSYNYTTVQSMRWWGF